MCHFFITQKRTILGLRNLGSNHFWTKNFYIALGICQAMGLVQ